MVPAFFQCTDFLAHDQEYGTAEPVQPVVELSDPHHSGAAVKPDAVSPFLTGHTDGTVCTAFYIDHGHLRYDPYFS